jgi:oligopeptidase A
VGTGDWIGELGGAADIGTIWGDNVVRYFGTNGQQLIYKLYHDMVQMSEFTEPAPAHTPPTTNPFFDLTRLPQFEQIDIKKHADEAIRAQIDAQVAAFKEFETDIAGNESPTFADVFDRMERDGHALGRTFGIIHHLSSVADTQALRDVKEKYIGELTDLGEMFSSSVPLFEAMGRIDTTGLSDVKKRVVQLEIDGMKRSGFGLPDDKRVELVRINKRLSELSMKFSENATDSNKATYEVRPEHRKVVSECPDFATASWRVGEDDGSESFAIGMNGPSVSDALTYIDDETVRKEIYLQYVARAGDINEPIIGEILDLRQERAELLGFATHTDYVLSDKMVSDVKELDVFYEKKFDTYQPMAVKEMAELEAFAGKSLNAWDVGFHANLFDKEKFGYSDSDTKDFFELGAVLQTLDGVVNEIFGVKLAEVQRGTDAFPETWHPDVRFFEIHDMDGKHRASVYYDPYVRPGQKRGGAWMCDSVSRSEIIEYADKPVAYIVCNQAKPIKRDDGTMVSLLTSDEVVTLFHEFSHSLQEILTDITTANASGIPGEWDSVEIVSQFLEMFAYNTHVLKTAMHYETREPMPQKMIDFILDTNSDKGGSQCRQMFLGNLDLELHRNWKQIREKGESIWDVQKRIYLQYMPHAKTYTENNKLLSTFGHIFAGGYSSGYYGYIFSKEISKDLYKSLIDAPDVDTRKKRGRIMMKTVYALGSSMSMQDIIDLYFQKIKE